MFGDGQERQDGFAQLSKGPGPLSMTSGRLCSTGLGFDATRF